MPVGQSVDGPNQMDCEIMNFEFVIIIIIIIISEIGNNTNIATIIITFITIKIIKIKIIKFIMNIIWTEIFFFVVYAQKILWIFSNVNEII